MSLHPPTSTLFPYTTLFRSGVEVDHDPTHARRPRRPRAFRLSGFTEQGDDLGPRKAAAQLWNLLLRSEEHTSELQSLAYLVCRLLLEKKKTPRGSVTHAATA